MNNPLGTFVAGLIWVAIFIGVGIFGDKLGGAIGTVISWTGFLFAGLSTLYLLQMVIKFATGVWLIKQRDQDDQR